MSLDIPLAATANFNLLPSLERQEAARAFIMHSAASFGDKLTHAGYLDVAVTYFLTTEDKTLNPEFQRRQIENMKTSGVAVDVVEVEADHCWPMSLPRYMARRILEVVSGGQVVGEGIRERV